MSVFDKDIIQDESDILKQKIYEDMIRSISQCSFETNKKIKHCLANYIVTSTKVIEDFDKVFVLGPNFT